MRSPSLAASLLLSLLAISLWWSHRPPEGPRAPEAAMVVQSPDTGQLPSPSTKAADRPLPEKREARSAKLSSDVLTRAVDGKRFHLELPDGREAIGDVSQVRRDVGGNVSLVEGVITAPQAGRYFFQHADFEGVAGELVGHILFEGSPWGWKVEPSGVGRAPLLVETHEDRILCVNYAVAPVGEVEEAPQAHPTNIPIPSYQTIIPLQSLPGATGVIYLDFDGEKGPFPGWGDFDAAPPLVNNNQIFEVWKRVVEDYQGFNLNITTDRAVFDSADEGNRQHVVVSPTTTAAPTAGGVAYVGSYNWPGDTVCWAFYSTGKTSAEVISHEVGHTLNLSHDGRISPSEGYYAGHGNGVTGWAPIMGVGYYENLTQWSKGEYTSANNTEDDLAIIVSNNDVDYREDDTGDTLVTARYLEIAANDSVSGEGIIERTGDVDAFRFTTTGGAVSLTLGPAAASPNLDILAELVEASTGTVVATSNPDLSITASISDTLDAGEYLLRIRGTGRGDPEVDGYSDYGSLGTYLISGSVAGGVKPERFTIVENSPAGTFVGTVPAREDHGLSPLLWSISGGDGSGLFSINPLTAELVVTSVLDFETLSTRWDDPATLELFVTATDTLNAALTETIRVVVTVADVNELSVMSDASVTMLEHTRPGTKLFTVAADDPDHFQFPVFSIVGGNGDGWFEIDAGTGELRVTGNIDVSSDITVPLVVRVTDQGTPPLVATTTVNVTVLNIAGGYQPGAVMRTYFEGIGGSAVSNLTTNSRFPNQPDSQELVEDFDGHGHGDSFGSTLRGYVIPPVTGSYRFWIAADESAQLRLSTTTSPSNATAIASVSESTDPYEWLDGGSQMSSPVTLVAGQAYYIEARHKDSSGDDHVSVAWSGPGMPKQLLRGLFVAPYEQNYAPVIPTVSFPVHDDAFAGQEVGTATVNDVNAGDSHGDFAIVDGNEAGIFAIDPVTGVLRVAAANLLDPGVQSMHVLTVSASDNASPPLSGTGTIIVAVLQPGEFAVTNLFQQVWTGIVGSSVTYLTSNLRYPYRPSSIRYLSGFESDANIGDSYGSRIRALVIPPASGSYTFYLSSDEDSRLLLGSGPQAAGAVQIASVTGYTAEDEWTKFASQKSAPVQLVEGEAYYIEVLHKENTGADHLQVGWTGPGIPSVTVIPAWALEPYDLNEAPVFGNGAASFSVMEGAPAGTVIGTLAATDPEGDSPLHAITASAVPGAFAIDVNTGVLTVANPAALNSPGVKAITVSAQDRGIGGIYPLKAGSIAVEITVISNNQPPAFVADPIALAATEDASFSDHLTASDPDAGDVITFTKIGGPEWLIVAPDGSLSGTPENDDVGPNEFVVQVADPENFSDQATLTISVANTNDAPSFVALPLTLDAATEDQPYLATVASFAGDPDAGDSLVFEKVSGPGWLTVAPDGSLSGTPSNEDTGEHSFVVRVTDLAQASAEATVMVFVVNTNDSPVISTPVVPSATQDAAYTASLAAFAADPDAGDSLVFSKVSGPGWLIIGTDGSLGGTPSNADVGDHDFVVQVTDGAGAFAQATASITVENVNDAPVFTIDPIVAAVGTEEVAYTGATIAGIAVDPDAGEAPAYSLVDGPPWLSVAPEGTLSGTPPAGSSGTNTFRVRATDPAGLFAEATLVIEIASALPLPWEESTIGSGPAGSSVALGDNLILTGQGSLAGRNDGLHFVWQTLDSDGTIIARLDSLESASPGALAGIMIRDTLATNSRHVFIGMTGGSGYRWIRRTGLNGNTSTSTSGTGAVPDAWLRLTRTGNTITASKSPDGVAWATVGSLTAALPPTCYFGLAVTGSSAEVENTATFSHVSVTP
ncbi:cadherin domain-containing protein [Luteolibacter soli]|uniref:Cadherin domain-containing protein n=1 Tax=Luteolibacter soli TaxID=3135280 RepID=A0ABU9AZ99_9BACT